MGASQSADPIPIANPASPAVSASGPLASTITLGAGCYWGTEKYVRKDFQKRFPGSIKSATVGFMAPDPSAVKNPSCVCERASERANKQASESKQASEQNKQASEQASERAKWCGGVERFWRLACSLTPPS
jgi:hypothetical protein